MECESWRDLISAHVDQELEDREAAAVEAHLAECTTCHAVALEFEWLRRRLRLGLASPPEHAPIEVSLVAPSDTRSLARRTAVAMVALLGLVTAAPSLLDPAATPEATSTRPEHAIVRAEPGSFDRTSVKISAGGTVEWVNVGNERHHLVRTLGSATASTDLAPGATDRITYQQPGVYDVRCTVHQGMTGEIVVTS